MTERTGHLFEATVQLNTAQREPLSAAESCLISACERILAWADDLQAAGKPLPQDNPPNVTTDAAGNPLPYYVKVQREAADNPGDGSLIAQMAESIADYMNQVTKLTEENCSMRLRIAEMQDNPGDRTEGKNVPAEAAPMFCPDCGPHVKIDEDGCCATCGRDAFEGREAWLEFERERLLDEVKKYWAKSRIYGEMAYKWRERCIAGGLAKNDERIEATEYQGYEARISDLGAQLAEQKKLVAGLNAYDDKQEAHIKELSEERDSLREQVRLWEATREDGRAMAEYLLRFLHNNPNTPIGHAAHAAERYLTSQPARVIPEPADPPKAFKHYPHSNEPLPSEQERIDARKAELAAQAQVEPDGGSRG